MSIEIPALGAAMHHGAAATNQDEARTVLRKVSRS
jgi:hypothetical protein